LCAAHAAAINEGGAGVGATIVLKVDGELRKTRLFRSHEQAELVGAIADTRTAFEGRGGNDGGRAGAHQGDVRASPEEQALLEAHGLGSGRVQ
jgi:hypothetical protein